VLVSHNPNTSTEELFTRAICFALAKSRGRGHLPKFQALYEEVRTPYGIADLVGVSCPKWRKAAPGFLNLCAGLPRGPVAELLAELAIGPRRKATLLGGSRTRFSTAVVEAALRGLNARRIVSERDGTFHLSPRIKLPDARLYAFEVKLYDWRRAAFQALQANAYASKSLCIFPAERLGVLRKNKSFFADLGIGVLLFDPENERFVELVRGKLHSPHHNPHAIDVMLRLAAEVRSA